MIRWTKKLINIAARAGLVVTLAAGGTLSPSFAQADNGKALFEKVKKEIEVQRLTESSINQLQQFVENNPKNSDGRLYLGLVLENMGLKEQSYEQLKLSVEYGPENPDALVGLCKKEISSGHVNAAMVLLNYGLKKFPNNPDMLFIVGDYLIKQKRPVEARRLLEQAYKLDSSLFGLATSLAQVYLTRDYTRAVKYASIDLKKRPTYDRALRVRGMAYTGLRKYAKAVEDLEPVFKNDPTLIPIAEALSQSYYWLGDYENALKPAVFAMAFTARPDTTNYAPRSWMVKVMKPLPKKDAIRLVSQYSNQITKKFDIPAFLYFIGTVYDQLNYRDQAISYYRKVIDKSPDYVMAHYRLGIDLELYKKDHEEALKYLTKAHNLRPWDNEINLAYLRLQDRMYNKDRDISISLKKWLTGAGKKNK